MGLSEQFLLQRLQNESEPCPVTGDDFLRPDLPGRISAFDPPLELPTNGQYVQVEMMATAEAPQRILIRQGATWNGQQYVGGRIVARYYGDASDPRVNAAFVADGSDILFEFQQCVQHDDGSRGWVPYKNYINPLSTGATKEYRMDGGGAYFILRFGAGINPPPPKAYLHVSGKEKCGGFGWRVATTYAYAWTTTTPDPNSAKIAVPEIRIRMYIGCRDVSIPLGGWKSVQNTSQTEVSEQFRGINVPVCCAAQVHAEASAPDGSTLRESGNIPEP